MLLSIMTSITRGEYERRCITASSRRMTKLVSCRNRVESVRLASAAGYVKKNLPIPVVGWPCTADARFEIAQGQRKFVAHGPEISPRQAALYLTICLDTAAFGCSVLGRLVEPTCQTEFERRGVSTGSPPSTLPPTLKRPICRGGKRR